MEVDDFSGEYSVLFLLCLRACPPKELYKPRSQQDPWTRTESHSRYAALVQKQKDQEMIASCNTTKSTANHSLKHTRNVWERLDSKWINEVSGQSRASNIDQRQKYMTCPQNSFGCISQQTIMFRDGSTRIVVDKIVRCLCNLACELLIRHLLLVDDDGERDALPTCMSLCSWSLLGGVQQELSSILYPVTSVLIEDLKNEMASQFLLPWIGVNCLHQRRYEAVRQKIGHVED